MESSLTKGGAIRIVIRLALIGAVLAFSYKPAPVHLNKQEVQKPQATVPKVEPPQPKQEPIVPVPVVQPEKPKVQTAPAAVPPPAPRPTGNPQAIALEKAKARGWTGAQWEALLVLWRKESGWNPNARNRSSGACGIPQALPCSKIPNPSSIHSQIEWGLGYIAARYGTPSKALAFHRAHNWY